jgi:hypothetical protein
MTNVMNSDTLAIEKGRCEDRGATEADQVPEGAHVRRTAHGGEHGHDV